MKSLITFKKSLALASPDERFTVPIKALWYDAKGDWNTAHHLIDDLKDPVSTRIHAYFHRKEGDIWNADYWYARAGEKRPTITLDEEWEELVLRFLS